MIRVARHIILIACCLGFALGGSAAPTASASFLRFWAPIVVTARAAPDLNGVPIAALSVWTYGAGGWRAVPWQVDEVVSGTGYAAAGDGRFTGDDELVFMASDMGSYAPAPLPSARTLYAVSVTDPLAPGAAPLVAFIARTDAAVPPPAADYVGYDASSRRLTGRSYTIGLNSAHPFIDYLAINSTGVNLIDRSKIRVTACVLIACSTSTEDTLPLPAVQPVKAGPVRVVLSAAGGFAYRDWLALHTQVDLPAAPIQVSTARLSLDFAPTVRGAVYRDANVLDGVTIDGDPDAIPATPFSPWRQVDLSAGRLINIFRVGSPVRQLHNYYLDDARPNNDDTGDKMSYGDNGIVIDGPSGRVFSVDAGFWAFAPAAGPDGPTLAGQVETPLAVNVEHARFPILYVPFLAR